MGGDQKVDSGSCEKITRKKGDDIWFDRVSRIDLGSGRCGKIQNFVNFPKFSPKKNFFCPKNLAKLAGNNAKTTFWGWGLAKNALKLS